MIIEIYGKQDCSLCESAKKKLSLLLKKWNLDGTVPIVFRDMETEEGAAEGDFHDVFDIPSVLLKEDGDVVVARWDGKPPTSQELRRRLCA
mgnify:CR=1 FL=1